MRFLSDVLLLHRFSKKQKIMNYPMITWCVIAGVLLFAFLFRAVEYYYSKSRSCSCGRKATHFLRFGRETDMFYVPGDAEIPGIADKRDENEGR